MRKISPFLCVTLMICVMPLTTHAQWAARVTEHDWRLTIGGHSYGLLQTVTYTVSFGFGGTRTTTICFGPYTTYTRITAPYVAAWVLLPAGAISLFLLTRLFRGPGFKLKPRRG